MSIQTQYFIERIDNNTKHTTYLVAPKNKGDGRGWYDADMIVQGYGSLEQFTLDEAVAQVKRYEEFHKNDGYTFAISSLAYWYILQSWTKETA